MRQWTIDAFADRPFMGNPAAVVEPFYAWPDDGWMQALAAENNLSETAFLRRTEDAARFDLRWFTPAMEVALCGHATLAAAHALMAEVGTEVEVLTFDTRSGPLSVRRSGTGYEMDFPVDDVRRIGTPSGLGAALGAEPVEVWVGRYVMAVMADAAIVRGLTPDIPALMAFHHGAQEAGQVIVCALEEAGGEVDVVDRFFGPGCGLPEDPATGSARGGLTPLFGAKLDRSMVRFEQAYPGRGARFECELSDNRVLIRGRALTVVESLLRL
jgi:predicted PhzF superfamily epimerase YddE/YHI9